MDKLMHKMGLHGKSFIPLIMGFGCNVPAIMATRTIESRRSRLITMMILPFMSCSARLPIYIMIVGTFFAAQYQALVMLSLYVVGIAVAVIMSKVFSSMVVKGEDTPFVMELPPYRWPTPKAIARHTWEKGKEYLKKMGGVILVASILVWALGYFGTMGVAPSLEESFIGMLGHAVEPLFWLQGFNWQLDVSLICGVGAKEIVASTMGVLGGLEGLSALTAYSFLLFVLLYFPCVATIVAIKNETGSWKWASFAAIYTTCVAWLVSAMVYQIGLML
jgi:ferrous iron transport protein B